MISKKLMVMAYLVLSLLLMGSSVFLAYEVRHFLYERTDPLAGYEKPQMTSQEAVSQINADEARERNAVMLVYTKTQAFEPLATPVPRPSPTTPPPASPTPVVPAKDWKVMNVMGTKYATLRDYTGQTQLVKPGQTLTNRPNGLNLDFTVMEISFNPPWVKVQDFTSGQVRIIPREPKAIQPKAPPKK